MFKSKTFLSGEQLASTLTVITELLKEFRQGRNKYHTLGKKLPFPLPSMLMDDEILNPLKALKAEIDAVLAEEEKIKETF